MAYHERLCFPGVNMAVNSLGAGSQAVESDDRGLCWVRGVEGHGAPALHVDNHRLHIDGHVVVVIIHSVRTHTCRIDLWWVET